MTIESTNTEIAHNFHNALHASDWTRLKLIMTHEIVWSLPGTSIISGDAKGADAVIHRFQTIKSRGVNFGLKHILVGKRGAALSLHNTAKNETAELDEHLAIVMTIHGDKITALDTYLSDVEMLNTYFAS